MRNIKLVIQYDGTNYSGWQFQKNAKTIQEVLEGLLTTITGEKIKVVGSGRTDAGVHAKYQVANFKTHSKLSLKNIHNALNATLPEDILISSVAEAHHGFDAQFDTRLKHYRYTVSTSHFTDPFIRNYVTRFSYPLNIAAMRRASRVLIGRHDFKAFQTTYGVERNTVRTIRKITIAKKGRLVYIDLEADGFLYNMVRAIVGTLLEIGRGKLPEECMRKILAKRDRRLCGPTAPAKGLCLMKVTY